MSQNVLTFRLVPEVRQSARRAVGFLEGHPELNAASAFNGLTENGLNFIRSSTGEWISGKGDIKGRFHGWRSDPEFWMCFTFKVREKRLQLRFYGYLCNPQPKANPAFLVCVLCIFAVKKEKESDQSELMRVQIWSNSAAAHEAVARVFPDEPPEGPEGETSGEGRWKM